MSIRVLEERARQLGKAGEWGQLALGVNTRILEIDPDNLAALTRRARCNLACDDYPAAKADYERALALGPRSRVQQEDLARGLAEVEAGWEEAVRRRAKREEKRERRERLFREIEGIEGFEEARALGILYAGGIKGGTSYSAGQGAVGIDRELAVAAFRRAYSIDPRRRTKAGGERLDPGLFEVPTRLGGVYRAMGEPDEAAKVYEWVLSHHDSRFARVGLAAVREDQGHHEEALEHYEMVLASHLGDSYALKGMARVLASLGREEELGYEPRWKARDYLLAFDLYDYDDERDAGTYYAEAGSLGGKFALTPTQVRATPRANQREDKGGLRRQRNAPRPLGTIS